MISTNATTPEWVVIEAKDGSDRLTFIHLSLVTSVREEDPGIFKVNLAGTSGGLKLEGEAAQALVLYLKHAAVPI
jgi:hypothetical protein